MCQRYYEEPNGSSRVGDPSSGTYSVQYNYIVTKRATPTVSTTTEGTRVGVSSNGIQSNNLNNCAEQVAVTASLNYVYSAKVKADAEI